MKKPLPLLMLALSALIWSSPVGAKQCADEERNRLRQLEHALVHCRGDAICEVAARDRGFEHLSRAECNVSVCESTGVGAGTGERCAFNTAEGPGKAIATPLTTQGLP